MKMKYNKSYDPVLLQVKANKFKTIVAIYNSHKNYNSLTGFSWWLSGEESAL